MAYRTIGVSLLLTAVAATGCGTAANLARPGPEGGGKVPFGGVHQDEACIQKAANGECVFLTRPGPGAPQVPQDRISQVALTLFWAVDLPFSFVGDVLTLPYTRWYTWINQPTPVPPIRFAGASDTRVVPPPPATPPQSNPPMPLPQTQTQPIPPAAQEQSQPLRTPALPEILPPTVGQPGPPR